MALINPHGAFWQLAAVQLIVDAGTGKPAHVVFRLRRRRKASLAGEFKVLPVSEVDMPLPGPRLGFTILAQYSYEGLIAVRGKLGRGVRRLSPPREARRAAPAHESPAATTPPRVQKRFAGARRRWARRVLPCRDIPEPDQGRPPA